MIDFNELALEATKSGYDPRAKRCWRWFHQWTMWEQEITGRTQSRRCLKCGRAQMQAIAKECAHTWNTIKEGRLVGKRTDVIHGHYYEQQCTKCGVLKTVHL